MNSPVVSRTCSRDVQRAYQTPVEVLSRRGYINFSALRVARFSDSSTAIDFAIQCRGTMSLYPTVVSVVKLKNTSSGGRISLAGSTVSRNEPGETS